MRIAIPKGRLQQPTLALFAAAGFDTPDEADLRSRKLVFTRDGIEWIFVKDCDVPVYVDHGAADVGVAGLDQILEHECTAYQPVELPFGRCSMMVIGAPGTPRLTRETPAKIATKYPRIARQYLDDNGIRADVVPLGGSVELAAVLRLTTHVIDLVETGETVRANRLELQDVVIDIAPRLIVAKSIYRTDPRRIRDLVARVELAAKQLTPDPSTDRIIEARRGELTVAIQEN
jgi:ATP phosphoribosyltransferase